MKRCTPFYKYVGSFNIKYAGDPYVMYFNLLFRFKDGKVKYELTDFVSVFEVAKSKNSANIFDAFSNGVNTTTMQHTQIPEILYAHTGMSDEKHYWKPMKYLMEETVTKFKKMIADAEKLKNEGW